MLREVAVRGAIGLIALTGVGVGMVHGAMIQTGFYRLHNHPTGSDLDPPPYGARLDELYNHTTGAEDYTFDFDYVSPEFEAAMWMTVTPIGGSPGRYTLTISGKAWGGRDTGSGYSTTAPWSAYTGIYEFLFEFVVGAQDASGDDDLVVDPDDMTDAQGPANEGWVKTPVGDTISLGDVKNGAYSFRFGDEDDNLGHDSYEGISGWGWVKHGGEPWISQSDWIFVAEESDVPNPGALTLMAAAGLAAMPRRRRR